MAEVYTSNGNRPAPTRKIRKLANVALNIDGTVGHIESMAVEVHDLTDRVGSMLDHLDSSLERLDDSLDSLNLTLNNLAETTSTLANTMTSLETLTDVVNPLIRVLRVALYPTKIVLDFADDRIAQIERALR